MIIKGGLVFDLSEGFVQRDLYTDGTLISQASADDVVIDASISTYEDINISRYASSTDDGEILFSEIFIALPKYSGSVKSWK